MKSAPDWFTEISPTTFRTVSGAFIELTAPDWRDISLEDIAHALAALVRWNGHRRRQISVLEHSLRVAHHAPAGFRLEALLHDAHEAYTGDISRPMQKALCEVGATAWVEALRYIQLKLDIAIARQVLFRWGAQPLSCSLEIEALEIARRMRTRDVKAADDSTLHEEARRDMLPTLLRGEGGLQWLSAIGDAVAARYATARK
jgi:hypothetical protein